LTLEQAAELSGMSPGNISAMERGAQSYTQSGLESLARAYRCAPAQLLQIDPSNPDTDDIWNIWESAKDADRRKIVEIARTITGNKSAAA
jgi:transcriptional regulator with XRE-family HTH domain